VLEVPQVVVQLLKQHLKQLMDIEILLPLEMIMGL